MNKKREKIVAEREKAVFQFIKNFLKKNGFYAELYNSQFAEG